MGLEPVLRKKCSMVWLLFKKNINRFGIQSFKVGQRGILTNKTLVIHLYWPQINQGDHFRSKSGLLDQFRGLWRASLTPWSFFMVRYCFCRCLTILHLLCSNRIYMGNFRPSKVSFSAILQVLGQERLNDRNFVS